MAPLQTGDARLTASVFDLGHETHIRALLWAQEVWASAGTGRALC